VQRLRFTRGVKRKDSAMRSLATAACLLAAGASLAFAQTPAAKTETATFAGGCFWCVESDFDKVDGVISTTSGYTGGKTANPTYREVGGGGTGHAEAVAIVYDPAKVSYEKLLNVFWRSVDPTVKDRQFCDSGNEYRTAIFYHNEEQRKLAEATKKEAEAVLKQPIVTEIVPASSFYNAEDYHQDYYKKNPSKYTFYRWNCGRDQRLQQLWGKKTS
jgi:peptide-methionine (S)-S-oxide reductase